MSEGRACSIVLVPEWRWRCGQFHCLAASNDERGVGGYERPALAMTRRNACVRFLMTRAKFCMVSASVSPQAQKEIINCEPSWRPMPGNG